MKLFLTFLLIIFFGGVVLTAQQESDFYRETLHKHALSKHLQEDYKVDGKGNDSDTDLLQKAINEVSQAGGGSIFIPRATYHLHDIQLKSNVHLLIEQGTKIMVQVRVDRKPAELFLFGRLDGSFDQIENVSIRGVGGRFDVHMPDHEGSKCFNFGRVTNFLVADFNVYEKLSKFSSMTFGIAPISNKEYAFPNGGVVKNAMVYNAHYGYGLIQAQAAKNVFFQNLSGEGGVTLRLETGIKNMNDLQVGGIHNIVGRNISCYNGNAAVMISPHAMHNGKVDIAGVTASSCGFAVRIGNGFIAKKYENPNLTVGSFEEVRVTDVIAYFGTNAQLKKKHYKYIPTYRENLITKASTDNGKTFAGPAIAAMVLEATGYRDNVTVTNVRGVGFLCQKPIVVPGDEHSKMDCE